MDKIEIGAIVLLKFPFTDSISYKRRHKAKNGVKRTTCCRKTVIDSVIKTEYPQN